MEVKNYLNVSSDMFVVREGAFDQKKDLLKRFITAYRDSANWMMTEPQEAANLATKRAIDGQNPGVNLEIIKLRNLSSVSATTQKQGLGSFDMLTLQKAAQTYKALGLIQKDIRVQDVVTQPDALTK